MMRSLTCTFAGGKRGRAGASRKQTERNKEMETVMSLKDDKVISNERRPVIK